MVELQRIATERDFAVDDLDELCKKRVVDAFDEQRNGVRTGAHEVSCAGVGDIVQFVDRAEYFFPRVFTDVRMVVEHA